MEKQILLVDDEKSVLHVLKTVFNRSGYAPRCAADGNEALEIVKRDHVRVCFVDLRMPGMDGMELCRQIKQLEPSASVFALSAFVDAHTPEQYQEAGFDGCCRKPFQVDALLKAAQEAFQKMKTPGKQPGSASP